MKAYLVCQIPAEHEGRLCEPIGIALTESEAVAMCEGPDDCVVELEAGHRYPIGEKLPLDVRHWWPLPVESSAGQATEVVTAG